MRFISFGGAKPTQLWKNGLDFSLVPEWICRASSYLEKQKQNQRTFLWSDTEQTRSGGQREIIQREICSGISENPIWQYSTVVTIMRLYTIIYLFCQINNRGNWSQIHENSLLSCKWKLIVLPSTDISKIRMS